MYIPWIDEVYLVIVPTVAGVRKNVTASGCDGLYRVTTENPIAEIDDVDVLFNKDISGEGAVPEPIT